MKVGRREFSVGVGASLVDPVPGPRKDVVGTARWVTADCQTPRQRAIALFNFVRDTIEFGFTGRFDQATAEHTLRRGRGHCNPQARLLVEMMRVVGLRARYHVVHIAPQILDGLFPGGLPSRLDHTFVEVEIEGAWIAIDGYIVDRPLLVGATRRLTREGSALGYGVHRRGQIDWDGHCACMSQLVDPSMVLRDVGIYRDQNEHYSSADYAQRLGVAGWLAMGLMAPGVNRRLNELRAAARGQRSLGAPGSCRGCGGRGHVERLSNGPFARLACGLGRVN